MKWIFATFASISIFLIVLTANIDVKHVTMHTALRACEEAGRIFLASSSSGYNKIISYHPHSLSDALDHSITGAPDTKNVSRATQYAYDRGETGGRLYTSISYQDNSRNNTVVCYFEYYAFGATRFEGIEVDNISVPSLRLTLKAGAAKSALEFIDENSVGFIDRLIAVFSKEFWEYSLNSK